MTCFPYIVGMTLTSSGRRAKIKSPREVGQGFFARIGDPFVGEVLLGDAIAPIVPMSFVVIMGESKFQCEYTKRRLTAVNENGALCEMEIGNDGGQFFIPIEGALTLRGGGGEVIRLVACGEKGRFVYFTGGANLLQRPYGFFGRSVKMEGFNAKLIGVASVASVAIQSLNVLQNSANTV